MDPSVAGPFREEEERRSAATVGVGSVDFLDYPDGLIESGVKLRRDLARAFRRLQPDIVVTMNFELTWGDGGSVNHSDHRAIGSTVLDACRDAANRWIFTDEGEPWAGIKFVYVAAANQPTHFVDIGETIELGILSLREHQAYIDGLGGTFDPDDFLRSMAGYSGMVAGCEYAVTFQRFGVG